MKLSIGGLVLLVALTGQGQGDEVLRWNDAALEAIRADSTAPPKAARALAMMHVAVYDAVNSVDRTHQPFWTVALVPRETSREAAAAEAAYRVLLHLFPQQQARFEAARAASLAALPESAGKTAGVELGAAIARQVIAWRQGDGSDRVVAHPGGSEPGQWRPTPPDFEPALLPAWRYVMPFALADVEQFRTKRPPALTSDEYAKDFEEVKRLGGKASRERTDDQTHIARFWADGAGTVTPPGHWNQIAQTVARAHNNNLHENARLFALLNVALADAAIACWDMKYSCSFWRPVTAIREAERDGNPQTEPDADWEPLLETPPFPTCTSGHSSFSSAAAEMLALVFGRDEIAFESRSEGVEGSRRYVSFSQAAEEAGRSRIYGGIHFEFDNGPGLAAGRAISRAIFSRYLRPVAATVSGSPEEGRQPSEERREYRGGGEQASSAGTAGQGEEALASRVLDTGAWRPAGAR